jgi:signal transduction histidine kinase
MDEQVKETTRVLERTIPENIQLLQRMGREKCVVNADPTRIQQVLMNLVVNARDAMPEGGELTIELAQVEIEPGEKPPIAGMSEGPWICMTISDTGTGIPPDVLPHIFEPFFTTKEAGQGTGLGLAQVHGIVTQHGGHIGVETEVGQGSTFSVYFPAYNEEAEESAKKTLPPPEGRGETILLVEDEDKLREVVKRY